MADPDYKGAVPLRDDLEGGRLLQVSPEGRAVYAPLQAQQTAPMQASLLPRQAPSQDPDEAVKQRLVAAAQQARKAPKQGAQPPLWLQQYMQQQELEDYANQVNDLAGQPAAVKSGE